MRTLYNLHGSMRVSASRGGVSQKRGPHGEGSASGVSPGLLPDLLLISPFV